MTLREDVQTATPASNCDDSVLSIRRGAATGDIRSPGFLVAPKLSPGQQQELVHTGDRVALVRDDTGFIVHRDWTRNIEGREKVYSGKQYRREYDDKVYQRFLPPGELKQHYHEPFRRFYLDGVTHIRHATDEIHIGMTGQPVQVSLNHYGTLDVGVTIDGQDTKTVHGITYGLHVGDKLSRHTGTALDFALLGSCHASMFGYGGDGAGELQADHDAISQQLKADLQGALNRLGGQHDPSDPNRLPAWTAPVSGNNPPLKIFNANGLNLALKATTELTIAAMRNSMGLVHNAARLEEEFIVGGFIQAGLVKALGKVLHQLSSILDIRAWFFGFGIPRLPTPWSAGKLLPSGKIIAVNSKGVATVKNIVTTLPKGAKIVVNSAGVATVVARTPLAGFIPAFLAVLGGGAGAIAWSESQAPSTEKITPPATDEPDQQETYPEIP